MAGLFLLQILFQLCLRGALNEFWDMYFTLQVICYLAIYDINMPGNTAIYVQEFTKIIEFELLNPDGIGGLVTGDKDFDFVHWLFGKPTAGSGAQSSILGDLRLPIAALIVFLAVLVLLKLLSYLAVCKKRL